MIIPLSNAIFGDKLDIEKIYKVDKKKIIDNLILRK